MNINPTEVELSEVKKCFSEDKIDYNKFSSLVEKINRKPDLVDNLLSAFKVFDQKDTGFIIESDLKIIMTTLGEVLSLDEITELVKKAKPNHEGQIDYKNFSFQLFDK